MANSQRSTREIPIRYRLEARKFACGTVSLARRYICPDCSHSNCKDYERITLKGTGKILTYTVIHIPADQFAKEAPFPVAVIETDEGARLTAQIVDCEPENVKIGAKVELVFRKIGEEGESGIINYAYKAKLA